MDEKAKKKVKQKIGKKIFVLLLPVILVITTVLGGFLLVASLAGAEMTPPAEENVAADYRMVCMRLGVPWDIVLLVDSMRADANDEDIESYNPLDTALEFTSLKEEKYNVTQEDGTDEENNNITIQTKTLASVTIHKGRNAILNYINVSTPGKIDVLQKAKETASRKSSDTVSYEINVQAADDIESVLSSVFGFDEEEIKEIMELHESNYISLMYGDETGTAIGNVTIGNSVGEEAVHQFLIEIGFNEIGACATMGNIDVESGFNSAANNGGHHFGICQWGGGRWTALVEFCRPKEWYDLEAQLNFFSHECQSAYKDVYMQMVNATDLTYATDYFCTKYEICIGAGGAWTYSLVDGKPYQDLLKRRAKAELYYAKYGKGTTEN